MQSFLHRRLLATVCLAWWSAAVANPSAEPTGTDWPRWRGPGGDGIVRDTAWSIDRIHSAPIAWHAELGVGYSSVSLRAGVLYSAGNRNDHDLVWALNATTGEPLWTARYPAEAGRTYSGPRATPVVDGEQLFMVSRDGIVRCFSSKDGTMLWERNVQAECNATSPRWGHAGSALLHGDKVLINGGEFGLALNRHDGSEVWKSWPGAGGYATPVMMSHGTRPYVLMFSRNTLYAVRPVDGERIWSFPWPTRQNVNAADPVPIDDHVFISSGYGTGCALIDPTGEEPRAFWRNEALSSHFSTPVAIGGYLYGIHGNAGRGFLRCIDIRTGHVEWSQNVGFGSLIATGDTLLILTERGSLVVAEATPRGYIQVTRRDNLLPRTCWTPPVLSHGMLYLRNDAGRLVCLDLREPERSEDRGPRTEDRRPQTEDRRPRTEDHRPQTEDHRPQTEDRRPQTADWAFKS